MLPPPSFNDEESAAPAAADAHHVAQVGSGGRARIPAVLAELGVLPEMTAVTATASSRRSRGGRARRRDLAAAVGSTRRLMAEAAAGAPEPWRRSTAPRSVDAAACERRRAGGRNINGRPDVLSAHTQCRASRRVVHAGGHARAFLPCPARFTRRTSRGAGASPPSCGARRSARADSVYSNTTAAPTPRILTTWCACSAATWRAVDLPARSSTCTPTAHGSSSRWGRVRC